MIYWILFAVLLLTVGIIHFVATSYCEYNEEQELKKEEYNAYDKWALNKNADGQK